MSSSSSAEIPFGMSMRDYMEFLEISLLDLESATSNFADKNLLSIGSSFKVYKGILFRSGCFVNIVAHRYQHEDIFYKELSIYNMLRHKNIAPIYKIVSAQDAKFIIKKHADNGSLEKHLNSPALTWRRRLHICVRIAHALKYLHYDIEDCHVSRIPYFCIIHGNIKSSKILLDHKWEPKLHDFRYAVASKMNTLHLTAKYYGSSHYTDPEYENTAGLTHKSDVFSFGVLLFEVLFGREASFQTNDNFHFVLLARSHYEEGTLDDLIDPDLRKQMSLQSLNMFAETAYYCIKEQRSQCENMNQVLSKLEEALKLQHKHDDPGAEGSLLCKHLKDKSLDHLRFRLRDIELATNNFSESYCIGSGGYGKVYRAKLNDEINLSEIEGQNEGKLPRKHSTVAIKRIYSRYDKQGEQGFLAEIEMLSNVKHPNIVSLLGFCDEGEEMILVYEYVSNGSLADYLEKTGQKANLTWAERIQICIDIAHGLKYLHTSTKDRQSIIHRDIKGANILLDENWVAKIADFGLSKLHPSNQQGSTLITNNIAGTDVYLDPEYLSTGRLKTKSDVYSFGVVLFEIMCGKLAHDKTYGQHRLPSIARQRFNEGTLNDLIDPKIKETDENILMLIGGGVDQDSFETFTKVAYQCLAKTQLERPTMGVVIKELEKALNFQTTNKNNLQIPLKAIKLGTQDFNDCNCMGGGRFWKLYKGEVEHADERTTIVAKRWDMKSNQRIIQFSRELYLLSRYKHENIVGHVGYCNEGKENIIVYEYASNGILNKYLGDPSLTWMQRLKICIDIAEGLKFLHGNNIEHGDINSGYILLDGDWNAKIFNFALSHSEGIYEKAEHVDNNDCNSLAYLDPENKYTKESGIYSLGVI
ncbi:uncharacterized protein LOC143594167 [Bidens hawaiensis]|uniref:uncharacterized protein LOC143594167 n=1 Tax=Bidens hawaiensis TaxID=980011 RepID=UPI004049BC16